MQNKLEMRMMYDGRIFVANEAACALTTESLGITQTNAVVMCSELCWWMLSECSVTSDLYKLK